MGLLKKNYLTAGQLTALKEYKYVSGDSSIMDKILTPYWNWVADQMPMWLAPNLITLLGLLSFVLAALQFIPFDLSMTASFPDFCAYAATFAMFVYQTLDAIDGKQARKTGTSSPLGQLFDHGCDAWSCVLTAYVPLQLIKVFPRPSFFVYLMGTFLQFFFVSLEEYHTGVLRTCLGIFGLTECQLFIAWVTFMEGWTSGVFSSITVEELVDGAPESIAKLPACEILILFSCLLMVYGLSNNTYTIFTSTKHSMAHTLEGFLPSLLMVLHIIFCFVFTEAAWKYPCIVVFSMGAFFALSATRLILATVTKGRYTLFEDLHLSFPMLFGLVTMPLNHIIGLNETVLLVTVLVWGLAIYFWYVVNVIGQICESLDIYCLTIKKTKKDK